MTTCDDFQIAIEQQLHGALGPDDTTRLQTHLEDCAGCRSYLDSVKGAEAVMNASAVQAAAVADWSAVERAVRRQLAKLVFGFATALVLVAGAGLLAIWGFGADRPQAPVAFGVPAAMAILMFVVGAWSVTRALELQRLAEPAQTLAWLRVDLGRRVRSIRIGRWVLVAVSVAAVTLALGSPALGDGIARTPWRWRVVDGIFGAGGLALLVWVQMVKLPRAVRELSELGPTTES